MKSRWMPITWRATSDYLAWLNDNLTWSSQSSGASAVPLDQMLKKHAEAHFAGGRGTTICDNQGTVSAFVVSVGEETVTFVVSTAKETMMTSIYLKGEVQSVKQEGS